MWLFTTVGFFSVVQKPRDLKLTVRSRMAGDLEALRDRFLPELGDVMMTPKADYPYRARVPHERFGQALARIAEAINYDNFKNQVARANGHKRSRLYGDVWSVMFDAERRLA